MFKILPRISALLALTDEQAMSRVQAADDHRAFAQLMERWDGKIRDLCIRMIGDVQRGEDLKQEAFARVFQKRKHYRIGARFSTWLWRIALNLCYDELRRIKRRAESPFPEEPEGGEAPSSALQFEKTPSLQLVEDEEAALVRSALLQLSEIYRTALVLRHYENLKLREIAEILEIPPGTVNSRLAEGLVQLTRLLEPHFNCAPRPGLGATARIQRMEMSKL